MNLKHVLNSSNLHYKEKNKKFYIKIMFGVDISIPVIYHLHILWLYIYKDNFMNYHILTIKKKKIILINLRNFYSSIKKMEYWDICIKFSENI